MLSFQNLFSTILITFLLVNCSSNEVTIFLGKSRSTSCHNGPTTFYVEGRMVGEVDAYETDTVKCNDGDAVRAEWHNTCSSSKKVIKDTVASEGMVWIP